MCKTLNVSYKKREGVLMTNKLIKLLNHVITARAFFILIFGGDKKSFIYLCRFFNAILIRGISPNLGRALIPHWRQGFNLATCCLLFALKKKRRKNFITFYCGKEYPCFQVQNKGPERQEYPS